MILSSLLLAASIALGAPSVEKNGVTILCYHAFNNKNSPYSFSIEDLDKHMAYFAERGYNFISWSDLKDGKTFGRKNIFVTVDDGNKSVYEAYFTVFKKYGIKPMLGIYPAIIGKMHYALTWKQLKELSDAGCDIAAHGYNHLYVNQKLYDSNRKAFNNETALSKKILEEKLGLKIEAFIYPFGVRSQVTIETLKALGYAGAFTIVNGETLSPLKINHARFELPRYMITQPTWKSTFAAILRKTNPKDKTRIASVEGGLFTPGMLYAAEKKPHTSDSEESKKSDLSFLDKQMKFVRENFMTMGVATYGYYSMWNKTMNSKFLRLDKKKDAFLKENMR